MTSVGSARSVKTSMCAGLAISRRFCLMMGGDITVKSVEGEGSTFTIEIPVKVVLETALRRQASDR